jgi:hypothetical protein
VQSITVHSGDLVDTITFHFADGSQTAFGESGGSPNPAFDLQCDEVLAAIHVQQTHVLAAIQFEV